MFFIHEHILFPLEEVNTYLHAFWYIPVWIGWCKLLTNTLYRGINRVVLGDRLPN